MRIDVWVRCLASATALMLAGAVPAADEGARREALSLYDAGRYEEAGEVLERLDAQGDLDGALLYRLSFCRRVAGDTEGERSALERAVEALSAEAPGADTLEPAFYLANAHANLRQPDLARQAAARATTRVESGDLSVVDDPLEWFRLGKLYADQQRTADAIEWYVRALEDFSAAGNPHPAYVRWVRDYLRGLGDAAMSRADFAEAEDRYATLVATGGAGKQDFDRLAVARVRLGKWGDAKDAWQKMESSDRADGNRARYSWRLAGMAESIAELPEAAASGRRWDAFTRQELETAMKEQAATVRECRARSAESDVTPEERADLARRIDQARPAFVAAALEYTARGHPIRETAFFGGYAPLIFRPEQWELLPPPAETP